MSTIIENAKVGFTLIELPPEWESFNEILDLAVRTPELAEFV
mgnify:CR=1 FL=1